MYIKILISSLFIANIFCCEIVTPELQNSRRFNELMRYLNADSNLQEAQIIIEFVKKHELDFDAYLCKWDINKWAPGLIGGYNPLTIAVSAGNKEIIKALIDTNADINKPNARGETALHVAIKNENPDLKLIQFLIDNKALVNYATRNESTPLYCALSQKNEGIAKFLIEANSDIRLALEPRDEQSEKAKLADSIVRKMTVEKISEIIPLPNFLAKIIDSYLVFCNLKENQTAKYNELMHESDINVSAVIELIEENYIDCREELCLKIIKSQFEGMHDSHSNALVIAIAKNKPEILKALVDKGANVDQLNIRYEKSLAYAVEYKNTQIISFLLSRHANFFGLFLRFTRWKDEHWSTLFEPLHEIMTQRIHDATGLFLPVAKIIANYAIDRKEIFV